MPILSLLDIKLTINTIDKLTGIDIIETMRSLRSILIWLGIGIFIYGILNHDY